MPDTHDDDSGGSKAALLAIRRRALMASTYAEWHQVGRDIETLGQKLANATARAEKAEAERDETRVLLYRIIGAVEHAYALNAYVELEPGETAPTVESLWAEVREIRGVSDTEDGWSAAENAEFDKLYGVEAAMRLRAANDRVWRVVQELRQAAVDAGRDAYQDPMAQRLSAALVGVAAAPEPGPAKSSTLIEVFLRVSGLTPAEVARLLGVSTGAVSAWSRGAVMNAAHFARLGELNRLAQQVPSATFYGRRASIMSPRDGKPSIYQQWLAASWTPPIDLPGAAADFEAAPVDYEPEQDPATGVEQ